jgi:BNR repeat protein
MLLNKNNNLVRPSPAWSTQGPNGTSRQGEAATVALDPRVGANIRLGNDPPALPPNMRAQAEPHIARSVANADSLVATFQEGRFTTSGAVDCGYSISHDGGLTWTRALIPNLTTASGGPYPRATDPVAGINLNGNICLCTLVATDPNFDNGAVVVSRSTDGGATFGLPTIAYQPPNNSVFPDKDWMAINTFPGTASAGRIVVTFTLFSNVNSEGAPIYRAYSTNGGATWSSIANVNAADANLQGSQPVFLPNGNLVIVYWNFGSSGSPGERLEAVISSDGGVTFGPPKRIAFATEYNEPNIRTGSFLPSAVSDRTHGNLFVVYQALSSGNPRILFTKSTNGGNNWSAPIAISNNPAGSGVFNPAINVSPDGQTVTAVFYDHRNNPGSTTLVDLYLAQSFNGGATWQPNIRLTSVSTDASLAPLTSAGYMLGDYQGVAQPTNANVPAVPVWIDTRTGNPDPFVARVGIAPQVNFTSWQAARLSLHQINNPALGGQSGDADGDGEDNLSEFKSGTNPNNPDSVVRTGKQLNISTRLLVQAGDNVGIGGFIINGTDPKKVILRAIGPSLTARGVPGALRDPTLELHDHTNATIAFNDNWKDSQQSAILATGLAPSDDRESAIVQTLAPGAYTAIVRGSGNTSGIGLIEAYDLDPSANSKLANISTRGFVGTGDDVMIGGFIVGGGLGVNGAGSEKVVVRGIGPSLTRAGVPNALQDPTLELHDGNGALVASNDNWRATQQSEIQATGLAPSDDRESAILATLVQGNHTVILRGKNNTTGVGLVEVYKVQ